MKLLLIVFIQLCLHFQSDVVAQQADLILFNGKIFTADDKQLYVQALAIKGNKILATGSNASIAKLTSAKTKQINLKGKTVVPGFNDAHDHPGGGAPIGKSYKYTEWDQVGLSKKSVLDSISRLVKQAKPGEWISGLIGTEVFFDSTMRGALDSLAPDNPVGLQVWWGHGMVINQKALQAVDLMDDDKDPVGGWYIRDGENKISGLQQNAQAPVWIALHLSEPLNLIKGIRSYSAEQLLGGITSTQFMGTGLNAALAYNIFREANLQQRIRIVRWPRSTPAGRQLQDWTTTNIPPTALTIISGIKYVIDGSPGEGNALRREPYHQRGNGNGRLNYPIDTIKQILREALASDDQLIMHMTADSSFSIVLALMQEVGNGEQWRPKRVRFEHNCVGPISAEQKKVLMDLGILMMHTPRYCQGSPLKSVLQSGVMVGIAPDGGTTNPFLDIMLATSSQSDPKENLNVEQAVIAYTKTNAYAEFAEQTKGTLKKGMLADLAVLSQDIFTIPASQLPATFSILTIMNGKIVHQQK